MLIIRPWLEILDSNILPLETSVCRIYDDCTVPLRWSNSRIFLACFERDWKNKYPSRMFSCSQRWERSAHTQKCRFFELEETYIPSYQNIMRARSNEFRSADYNAMIQLKSIYIVQDVTPCPYILSLEFCGDYWYWVG